VVYGGGAITPDVVVPYDTLTTPEQKLARELNKSGREAGLQLDAYALDMKTKVKPDFVMTDEMRDDFYKRLTQHGVTLDRKDYDAGSHYIDRLLDSRISGFAFGDSTAKRREVSDDRQLVKAIDILKHSTSTKELLALAASMPSSGVPRPKQK
jgi:carboxyl-terminal processing protease